MVFEPSINTAAIKATVNPIGSNTSLIDTVPDTLVDCKIANIDNITTSSIIKTPNVR